ncbi:MAG: pseudouridine-5'-phosphate glycosidase [Bacilli bacterium]|nr:pseudouridine-5'-phosphate glycosidase [Bacilli bacterium]
MRIRLGKHVEEALKNNQPIVALESTIISHGMPYPENVETALKCEETVLKNGAVPATIALIQGEAVIGLSHEEIDYIGRRGLEVVKVSRRDLPYVMAKSLDGATTVSATMILASIAGIKVFATGGIGGVHKKAEVTMDISNDLEELAQTNVCVVCAGAKAILDLEKTLEYLETKGVLVLGYGTDKLPAFYTRTSEYDVNFRVDTPKEIADILKYKWEMNLNGGVLVTNPVPAEYSLDENVMNKAISEALAEAEALNITGKKVTPFLLAKIKDITGGESLKSNIQLVLNNCALASKIAAEYNK